MNTVGAGAGFTRRTGIGLLLGQMARGQGPTAMARRLPAGTPAGVAAILERTLKQEPGEFNTDWFGTSLMSGLLAWAGRGAPETRDFARRWFESHLMDKEVSRYSGPKGRTVRAGGILITTYAGHFGLSFPCYELYRQTGDERARRVCIEVAEMILQRTARNRFGMVMHDDDAAFTIPDVCYFAVTPLMIASMLDGKYGRVYRDQAVLQLRSFNDVFLARETGLVKTILFQEGLGKSYWTRATGWLLWAMCGVLRHLPADDSERQGFLVDLNVLAGGIRRAQDASGALRLFVNDVASPLETTGTAMCATGLHEAVRRRWIAPSYGAVAARAWEYVKGRISAEGEVTGAYTGWALPAEKGVVSMDQSRMGWIPGFVLSGASEMGEG